MSDEKTIAEEFGVKEREYDKIWNKFLKIDKKNEDLIDLIKAMFPDSKEDQVLAYFLHVDGIKRGEQSHSHNCKH